MSEQNKIIFLMIMIIFTFIILISVYMSDYNFSKQKLFYKNEIECGIYNNNSFNSMSMMYCIFLIVFMIFDLEIILFFCLINKMMNFIFLLILMFILVSLMMELFESSIKWND